MVRLAFVGDIHGRWSDADNRWFAEAGYDLVVFVGDLAGLRWAKTLEMARLIGGLRARALVIPGNHDATHVVQLAGEAFGLPGIGRPFRNVQARRTEALRDALGEHVLSAYAAHPVGEGEDRLTLIVGRPFSMGGPTVAFAHHLADAFGIHGVEDSADRLCSLVDQASDRIVFAAHNGPTGLGDRRSDIWGCDFRKEEGDWGDPDLRVAIDHAISRGKQVLAVVGGHMHRRLKGGGERTWKVERDGIVYVNAARVPRIRDGVHHHVALTLDEHGVHVEDLLVEPAR